jgi:hypothetical protein
VQIVSETAVKRPSGELRPEAESDLSTQRKHHDVVRMLRTLARASSPESEPALKPQAHASRVRCRLSSVNQDCLKLGSIASSTDRYFRHPRNHRRTRNLPQHSISFPPSLTRDLPPLAQRSYLGLTADSHPKIIPQANKRKPPREIDPDSGEIGWRVVCDGRSGFRRVIVSNVVSGVIHLVLNSWG